MRRGLCAVGLWALLACASPPPRADPLNAPPAPSDPPRRFTGACLEACGRKNMMRAVSASMIDAECAEACRDDWRLPLVRDAGSAHTHRGARVRVRGRWSVAEDSPAILLGDGTRLRCVRGVALDLALPSDGAPVWAVGALSDGELSQLSTLAPVD